MLRSMSQSPVVVILAAGLGTRMKSERTKILHEVAGRSLIAWVADTARAAGAARVVAVLGHQNEKVKEVLDARYGEGKVEVALQMEQKGTGHAVMMALPALESESDDRIVVILTGDAPLLLPERVEQLTAACDASKVGIALLSTTPPVPMAYGRLVQAADGTLERIVEHKDATEQERKIQQMNAGFYAVKLGVLRKEVTKLSSDNAQGELYLTDIAPGATVIDVPFDEVHGINDRTDLARVNSAARRRINEGWMREGVTMVAPDQVFIDADSGPIGADAWIAPQVCVRGATTIGARTRVDVGSVLTNVTIGDDVWIKPHCVLGDSKVGPRAQIGPFSHLRPDSVLDEDVKVGNFVETKKTHLMAGAKANHLAYLGDAAVGAKANIGAGTITCNYDGVNKFKTTIESGAFIGSDSQLVAPVTIGRDAYVGSGTTVTKDVPRGSLALSRTKQVNVDGWADRFRETQAKRKR